MVKTLSANLGEKSHFGLFVTGCVCAGADDVARTEMRARYLKNPHSAKRFSQN